MQTTSRTPAATSFLNAVRCFRATSDRILHLTPANCDRRLHRVTRDEISAIFKAELGYSAQV
jgi:hypothetical protein